MTVRGFHAGERGKAGSTAETMGRERSFQEKFQRQPMALAFAGKHQ